MPGGSGASPPEYCGGPTGYRLMQKRQQEGKSMATTAQVESVIAMLTEAHPDQPAGSWIFYARQWTMVYEALTSGWNNTGPWSRVTSA